jgi:hypothetical protein
MKMKKKPAATAKKKAAKRPAAKGPTPKKAPAKKAPASKAPSTARTETRAGTYTPQPVQGIGWAPFRYPPQ